MANGRVEIHDPLSHDVPSSQDTKPTSDSDGMEDTAEFRVMMAYATRRRPLTLAGDTTTPGGPTTGNGTHTRAPQTPDKTKAERKKRKKMGLKHLSKIFSCVKPAVEEEPRTEPRTPDVNSRSLGGGVSDDVKEDDKLVEAASRLTELADEIPFTPPEIDTDASGDDVETMIGLLLREAGDQLNAKDLEVNRIAAEIFLKYSFFEKLMNALLIRMGLKTPDPDALGPKASPKTHIAVTCEVASRLSAVNTLPMNRMLSHGARYLRDYYSSWVEQNGGYEGAFHSDDEEDEEEDEVQ